MGTNVGNEAYLGMPSTPAGSWKHGTICLQVCQALVDAPCPRQGFRAMLKAAESACAAGVGGDVVQTMLREAFLTFEDHIAPQKARVEALAEMAATLCQCGALVSARLLLPSSHCLLATLGPHPGVSLQEPCASAGHQLQRAFRVSSGRLRRAPPSAGGPVSGRSHRVPDVLVRCAQGRRRCSSMLGEGVPRR